MDAKIAADLVIVLAWMWLGLLAIAWLRERWMRRRNVDPQRQQRDWLSGVDPL